MAKLTGIIGKFLGGAVQVAAPFALEKERERALEARDMRLAKYAEETMMDVAQYREGQATRRAIMTESAAERRHAETMARYGATGEQKARLNDLSAKYAEAVANGDTEGQEQFAQAILATMGKPETQADREKTRDYEAQTVATLATSLLANPIAMAMSGIKTTEDASKAAARIMEDAKKASKPGKPGTPEPAPEPAAAGVYQTPEEVRAALRAGKFGEGEAAVDKALEYLKKLRLLEEGGVTGGYGKVER